MKPEERKKHRLGMNPSTASHRLVKDLLWKFVVQTEQNYCFLCRREMSRETFSIEHKTPWLHSENPKETFFDLDNISFSHLSCNSSVAKRPNQVHFTDEERRRCQRDAQNARRIQRPKEEKQEIRRKQYLRTGK